MFIFVHIDTIRLHQGGQSYLLENSDFFDVRNGNGSFVAKLRKRKAFPSTYCVSPDGKQFQFGYGPQTGQQLDDEYLRVTINSDSNLRIERDVYCTLPLYYAYQDGKLVISNLYSMVAAELAYLIPDDQAINAIIAGNELFDRRTPYSNIKTIEERAVLTLSDGKLKHTSGKERNWRKSFEAPAEDPHQFLEVLQQSFDRLIYHKLAKGQVAFEMSGGLDSSTLPLYVAQRYPDLPLLGVAMLFNDMYRVTQKQKLDILRERAHIDIIEQKLEIGYNSPLQRVIQGGGIVPQPIPSPLEVYNEPTRFIAELLHQRDIDIIVTGIGGDELFEHIVDTQSYLGLGVEVYQRYQANMPPYMTAAHQKTVSAALHKEGRLPLLSVVTHSASVTRSNTYIENGIWPVSQFADPYLVRFSQGLPAHFKANKNILRAFYQAHQFPAELYNNLQNEDFEPFFEETFYRRVYDRLIDKLIPHSYTVLHNYVDADKLRFTYENAVRMHNTTWLYQLYCWMVVEIDLLYHRAKLKTST